MKVMVTMGSQAVVWGGDLRGGSDGGLCGGIDVGGGSDWRLCDGEVGGGSNGGGFFRITAGK